jgi:dienelactone hydrolase
MTPSVVSIKPVVLPAPAHSTDPELRVSAPATDRGTDLEVRVSAPATGRNLPVILFSHGFGWSMDGYAPLADHWAANGFVVLQPTHLDSRRLGLPPDDPRTPHIWRHRIADLKHVLDNLTTLESSLPGLTGRVDRTRIAVAGHSWGAQTASTLLGARVLAPTNDPRAVGGYGEDLSDPRIQAGVLIAMAGEGGANLTPFAREHFTHLNASFAAMSTPALLITGDRDQSPLTVRGPDWLTDGYHLSPGDKSLLTVVDGEHSLGGISGYDVAETTDENPERVAFIQRLTTAYLQTALGVDTAAWPAARKRLADDPTPLGHIKSKHRSSEGW